jgi:uncharacterized membrane protein
MARAPASLFPPSTLTSNSVASRRILFVQTLPAAVALLTLWLI